MPEPTYELTVAKRQDLDDAFVFAYLNKMLEHKSTHPDDNYTRIADLSIPVGEDMARVLGVGDEFSSEDLRKHLSERSAYLKQVAKSLESLSEKIK